MANEAIWQVISSSFAASPYRTIYNSPQAAKGDQDDTETAPRETRAVQLGSEYLYILKEQLIAAGWTVVSSSYRVNESDPEGTKYFPFYYKTGVTENKTKFLNSLVEREGYTNKFNANLFAVASEDRWLPKYGIGGDLSQGDEFPANSAFTDVNGTNPAFSVIYPGYVPIVLSTTKNIRGLDSGEIPIGTAATQTGGAINDSAYVGRSWILLKAPNNFKEDPSSDNNYHIVIDYTHKDRPYWVSTTNNVFNDFKPQAPELDYNDQFGAFINICILPDYKPGDGLTNIGNDNVFYEPSPFKRPSHREEVGCVVRTSNTSANSFGNTYFKFIDANDTADNTEGKYYVNTIAAPTGQNPGTIIMGSIQGVPTFYIILSSISDPISKNIISANDNNANSAAGSRLFMFWSCLSRKILSNTVSINTTNGTLNPIRALSLEYQVKLLNTIFDSYEDRASMWAYTRYSPNSTGTKYVYNIVNTCLPVFNGRRDSINYTAHGLLSTLPFSKATSEYTYMEWPLPLIAVQGVSSNFMYLGRMMDIKLGHASAPDGILAKEDSTSVNFDRISLGGLWFPYAGADTLLF